jgi:hypothetical protein
MFKEIVLVPCGRREDGEAHQRSLQEPADRDAHDVQPGLSPQISPSRNERECAFCKPDGPASEDKRDLLIVPPQGPLASPTVASTVAETIWLAARPGQQTWTNE